jgi:thiol:disulfide interchange protein
MPAFAAMARQPAADTERWPDSRTRRENRPVLSQEPKMNFVPVVLALAAISHSQSSQPVDYKTAYTRSQQDERPLLVLVTAQWCPPCQLMKQTTIPRMIDNHKFDQVHFATVDLDVNTKDARNLIGSRGVPQLVLYEKQGGVWTVRFLSGYHDVAAVESFLTQSSKVRTAGIPTLAVGQ